MPHAMVVLLMPDVLPLDFAIPMHIFAREVPEFYDVATATPTGRPVRAAGGIDLVPDGGLELLGSADTIVIPGYAGAASRALDPVLGRALVAAAGGGTRMVSVCSGAFALAQAGLLSGLTVTTHWSLSADLAEQYPDVTVDAALLFADNGSVLTSAGVTAGVDLCLHILCKDLGPSVANHVSRRIVMAPRRDGDQAQFFEAPPIPPADDAIAATQQWMLSVLDQPVTVSAMARHATMSLRTFHRRFRERTGMTPLDWLHGQRIQRTKELLETTDLPVEELSARVGLGSPANLRVLFRRATSVSPSRHRQQFSLQSQTAGPAPAAAVRS